MAKPRVDKDWDPLGGDLPPKVEAYRRSREADNVVGSYFNATDLLAEALQNAADAIDERSELEEDAQRAIEIDFDGYGKSFSVSDTGTGMSRTALDIVFQPNITLKSGPLARPSARSWRGEKGVGLSFLLFSCDELRIRTCDGEHRYDAEICGAASWASAPDSAPAIEHELRVSDADVHLGSERYTVITLNELNTERFDSELFDMTMDEVMWTLRTRTAVGNTAFLFEDVGFEQPEDILVKLHYHSPEDGEKTSTVVPYRYATPEDLLKRAAELEVTKPIKVYDAEDLEGLGPEELRAKLKGAAVRYVDAHPSPSGYEIAIYMFAMAGDAMHEILEDMLGHDEVEWVPEEWQRFWVATRDMPTGVALRAGVLPTRGYEQRTFGLLQWEELKLDVGRKSLHGRTAAMFKKIVRIAWSEEMRWIVERIPRSRQGKGAGAMLVEQRARQAAKLANLRAGIPFAKVPDRRSAVAAVFHELLGSGISSLPELHGLTTGVFTDSDLLATNGHGENGDGEVSALHVVFGLDIEGLVEIFDEDREGAETVDLAVVWRLDGTGEDEDLTGRFTVETLETDDSWGGTHLVHFAGVGGREEPLRVIVLADLTEGLDGG